MSAAKLKSLEEIRRARKMKIGDKVQRGGRKGVIVRSGRFGDWIIEWSDGAIAGCYEHDLVPAT